VKFNVSKSSGTRLGTAWETDAFEGNPGKKFSDILLTRLVRKVTNKRHKRRCTRESMLVYNNGLRGLVTAVTASRHTSRAVII
jgi:hypothetical protein